MKNSLRCCAPNPFRMRSTSGATRLATTGPGGCAWPRRTCRRRAYRLIEIAHLLIAVIQSLPRLRRSRALSEVEGEGWLPRVCSSAGNPSRRISVFLTTDDRRLMTKSVLRLEVAGFAAIEAVVVAVLHQADVMLTLTEAAVSGATAVGLLLFALHADVFVGHAGKLYREDRQLAIGRSPLR